MSVRAYFQNIYDNVRWVLIGMWITLKYCFQRTVTVQYPERWLSFAPRYRGIHEFEAERCIDKQKLRTPLPIWMERNGGRIAWVKEEADRVRAGQLATMAADIPKVK